MELDRRAFVGLGLAALPALAGWRPPAGREPLALATADTEAHVVVVGLARGEVQRRLATVEDPRSIESGPGRARRRGPPGGRRRVAADDAPGAGPARAARARRAALHRLRPRRRPRLRQRRRPRRARGRRRRARAHRGRRRGRRRRAPPLARSGRAHAVGRAGIERRGHRRGRRRRSAAPAPAPPRAPAVPGPRRGLLPQRAARVGHRGPRAPPRRAARRPAGAPCC